MAELHFLNAADSDLDDIDDFSIAHFGDDVAETYIRGFEAAFQRLSEFPNVGRLEPDVGQGIRCLSHRLHRIYFAIDGSTVIVIRILHHARDARRALKP